MRNRRELAVDINVINYVPTYDGISESVKADYVSEGSFVDYYKNSLPSFDENYFEALNEALDKVVFAKPKNFDQPLQILHH